MSQETCDFCGSFWLTANCSRLSVFSVPTRCTEALAGFRVAPPRHAKKRYPARPRRVSVGLSSPEESLQAARRRSSQKTKPQGAQGGSRDCIVHYGYRSSTQNLQTLPPGSDLRARREIWFLFPLPCRRNRLFERRHIGVCGHHVRWLRHVRLASKPCAHRLAISHGESAFTPHRHPFTGPAMRRRHRNTEIARDGGPAFERPSAVSGSGGFPVGRLLFGKLRIHGILFQRDGMITQAPATPGRVPQEAGDFPLPEVLSPAAA